MEAGEGEAPSLVEPALELLMPQHNDLSRSLLALDQASTLIAVIEMSQSSWLVAAIVPGIARHPLKKINPDETMLLGLLRRWQDEAAKAGRAITRIAIAYEAGRDGFWLARWLRARGIEAYVIHPTSIPVSREHRRAKTDRLHTQLLLARLSPLAGRRARPLQHGGHPDPGRGGCQAPEPRAGDPGQRAHPAREPDQRHAGPSRHPGLPADPPHHAGAPGGGAYAGGGRLAAQHIG